MNALNGVWSDTYNPADHNQVRIREVKHLKKKKMKFNFKNAEGVRLTVPVDFPKLHFLVRG